jgi:putative addiction module CopG family antidote
MKIAISGPLEDFVKQAVREGRYASESEVVNQSLRMLQENERKLTDLRAMIAESLKDDTVYTAEEMDRFLEEQDAELRALGFPE